ncbi:hypothetical protein BC937DRAFT_87032 [Endogone sp. FLAS-F59071]|nr:hypothetical protein BC937DRAFT_87032 [Endogone sp. FLAS-F59071]|eukprot:RUS19725.1 hypothetical protein BC937DRAFT_87032 [Endogone sp. FLAS-F59071]
MDSVGYTLSSGYPSLASLTLDTTSFMDTQDICPLLIPPPVERDDTDIVSPWRVRIALCPSPLTAPPWVAIFTKRKNWSKHIIAELKDLMYVLNPAAKVMYCSPSSLELVGYAPEELLGHHTTEFIHVDNIDMFIRATCRYIRPRIQALLSLPQEGRQQVHHF